MDHQQLRTILKQHNIDYQIAIPFQSPIAMNAESDKAYALSNTVIDLENISYASWDSLARALKPLGVMPLVVDEDYVELSKKVAHYQKMHKRGKINLDLLDHDDPDYERLMGQIFATLPQDNDDYDEEQHRADLAEIENAMPQMMQQYKDNFAEMRASGTMSEKELATMEMITNLSQEMMQNFLDHPDNDDEDNYDEDGDFDDDDEMSLTLADALAEALWSPNGDEEEECSAIVDTCTNYNDLATHLLAEPLTLDKILNSIQPEADQLSQSDLEFMIEDLLNDFDQFLEETPLTFDIESEKPRLIEAIKAGKIDHFQFERLLFESELTDDLSLNQKGNQTDDKIDNPFDGAISYIIGDATPLIVLLPIEGRSIERMNALLILAKHRTIYRDTADPFAAQLIAYLTLNYGARLVGFPTTELYFYLLLPAPMKNRDDAFQISMISEKIFAGEYYNDYQGSCREYARKMNHATKWALGTSFH